MKTLISALILTAVAAPAFAPLASANDEAIIAQFKKQVEKALHEDLRLVPSVTQGILCGAEGKIYTIDVQIQRGHRTWDEASGTVGAGVTWESVGEYSALKEDILAGKGFMGPGSVCLE